MNAPQPDNGPTDRETPADRAARAWLDASGLVADRSEAVKRDIAFHLATLLLDFREGLVPDPEAVEPTTEQVRAAQAFYATRERWTAGGRVEPTFFVDALASFLARREAAADVDEGGAPRRLSTSTTPGREGEFDELFIPSPLFVHLERLDDGTVWFGIYERGRSPEERVAGVVVARGRGKLEVLVKELPADLVADAGEEPSA